MTRFSDTLRSPPHDTRQKQLPRDRVKGFQMAFRIGKTSVVSHQKIREGHPGPGWCTPPLLPGTPQDKQSPGDNLKINSHKNYTNRSEI